MAQKENIPLVQGKKSKRQENSIDAGDFAEKYDFADEFS